MATIQTRRCRSRGLQNTDTRLAQKYGSAVTVFCWSCNESFRNFVMRSSWIRVCNVSQFQVYSKRRDLAVLTTCITKKLHPACMHASVPVVVNTWIHLHDSHTKAFNYLITLRYKHTRLQNSALLPACLLTVCAVSHPKADSASTTNAIPRAGPSTEATVDGGHT